MAPVRFNNCPSPRTLIPGCAPPGTRPRPGPVSRSAPARPPATASPRTTGFPALAQYPLPPGGRAPLRMAQTLPHPRPARKRRLMEIYGMAERPLKRERVFPRRHLRYAAESESPRSSTAARRISATLHACAMQPRGRCGGSPSKISDTCPSPASRK